jgi:NADH-quinone oxidoreductase subunit A
MPSWPFLVHVLAAALVVALMLGLSRLLGERHRERATAQPYESGVPPTPSTRGRVPSHFYLVAMLFVVFDVEAVFVFAWSVSARDAGWVGYVEIMIFVAVLLAALVYLWRSGALDWGAAARSARTAPVRPPGHPGLQPPVVRPGTVRSSDVEGTAS